MNPETALNLTRGFSMPKKDTNNHNGLECPHCGYLNRDVFEIFTDTEQQIEDYECEECEKIFTATIQTYYTCEGLLPKEPE